MANNIGKSGGLCRFLEGMVWNGYKRIIVLGWDDENAAKIPQLDGTDQWFFGGRHTMVSKLLDRYKIPDEQLIIGVDSFDVLVQESVQTTMSKYAEMKAAYESGSLYPLRQNEFGCSDGFHPEGSANNSRSREACPLLFYATEQDCWPPSFIDMYNEYYRELERSWPEGAAPSPLVRPPAERTYRHLNGGGYVGPAGALRRVLREIIADKDAYAQHELGYDETGAIVSEGRSDQRVLLPLGYARANGILPADADPAADPAAAAADAGWWNAGRVADAGGGQVLYSVPGVFRRSDQITPALTLLERRHPLALDTEAAIFQAIQPPLTINQRNDRIISPHISE